jgi:hypothetical protein
MEREAHSIGDHASMLPKNDSRCDDNDVAARPFFGRRRSVSPPVHLPPERTASQGLSLNRSQYGGCSTKYNTPAGTQVVYRRFGGEQVVFPESSHKTNSSQSSSLTPAVCPGVHLAGRVDATPLAKRHVSTPLC